MRVFSARAGRDHARKCAGGPQRNATRSARAGHAGKGGARRGARRQGRGSARGTPARAGDGAGHAGKGGGRVGGGWGGGGGGGGGGVRGVGGWGGWVRVAREMRGGVGRGNRCVSHT